MKTQPCGRILVIIIFAVVTVLWAGEPWKQKPYTEWSVEDVDKVLEDSPWAKSGSITLSMHNKKRWRTETRTQAVYIEGQLEYLTYEVRVPYDEAILVNVLPFVVRWASSLTVRQAELRWRVLVAGSMKQEQASWLLQSTPKHFGISVTEYSAARTNNKSLFWPWPLDRDVMMKSAYLELKEGRKKIYPVQTVASKTSGGIPSAMFFFPRELEGEPVINSKEKEVEFHWKSPSKKIKTTFDLRKMVRDGKPDL